MVRLRRVATRLSVVLVAMLGCGTLICALRSDARLPVGIGLKPETITATDSSNSAATSDESGWPNLFGPKFNSTSAETGISTAWPADGPPVIWRASVGEGYSSPVALEDQVIVFHRPHSDSRPGNDVDESHSSDEVISSFDFATGQERWQFRHPTGFRCRTHYSSGPYSTPVLDATHVYALGTEGILYCLARADGALLWKRELWCEFSVPRSGYFPPAGSPLVLNDRLILNLGAKDAGAGIIALDKNDGRTLWTATNHGAGYATPCAAVIHGRPYLFAFTAEALVSIDPDTGTQYWEVPFRANNPEMVNATSPVVLGDIVFTSGYSLGNLCLQIQPDGSYTELWRDKRRNLDSQYNPLLGIDGWIYGFAALDDTFRCVNLRTGELAWKGLRELKRGAAIAADGHFILLGTEGHLASVRIDHRKLEVTAQTKEPVIAPPAYSFPALHRGRLLVRNEVELVCLDLKADSAKIDRKIND